MQFVEDFYHESDSPAAVFCLSIFRHILDSNIFTVSFVGGFIILY